MPEAIISKVCSKCQVEKPVSEFSKDKHQGSKFKSQCKGCVKKYREAHGEHIKEQAKAYRLANRDIIKEYTVVNKDKLKEYKKNRYIANRGCLLEKAKTYAKEHSQEIKKRMKAYRLTQKGKIAETKGRKKYRKTEKGRLARLNDAHRRRASKLGATTERVSSLDVFLRDKYICQICGIKTRPDYKNRFHPKRSELDHIIPLSKGGEHSMRNTQCLCHQCNASKNNHENFGDQLRLF